MIEVYRDSQGEYRWRILAKNHRILADSAEGYKTLAKCKHGLMATAAIILATALDHTWEDLPFVD